MTTAVEQRAVAERQAASVFRKELDGLAPQIALALPSHIPPERFTRVVMTAVQNNPKLLDCNRRSLWNACMKAAQDGLLPDGREGAIVPYGSEASWLPMTFGIQKKARNSGELSGISAFVVLKAESFRRWVDESGEHVLYEPNDERPHVGSPEDAAKLMRCVLAMAKTKDGEMFVEVMSVAEVERVRAVSRASKGESPWFQWYGEMAKKTAIKRLSKRLPMSSDLDDLIRRDDELYDLEAKPKPATVLDLDAVGRMERGDLKQIGGVDPPTKSAGGEQPKGDNGSRSGGSGAAPPPADTDQTRNDEQAIAEPSPLERSIVETLLDCKRLKDCDGVRMLFQKELIDAGDRVLANVEAMIEGRKDWIKAQPDYFPGDEQ